MWGHIAGGREEAGRDQETVHASGALDGVHQEREVPELTEEDLWTPG